MLTVSAVSSAIQPHIVAFKATDKKPETYPEAAIASLIIPGSGQFIKGENEKALIDIGTWGGLLAVHLALGKKISKDIKVNLKDIVKDIAENGFRQEYFKSIYRKASKIPLLSSVIMWVAGPVHHIHSAIDAYHNDDW
ncbi:MAG: hypothetical protein A2Y25_11990 [Candidatus Melainabacteria bacterium GWF2_37_15]|nr:MAG: hypothetical protein A2Y25_11990 [Candidatus Melainabacteria bacterium GWF2_37_15]